MNQAGQAMSQRWSGSVGLLIWGLLRFPALLVVLYLFRGAVLSSTEQVFDIIGITRFVIALASTPVTRAIIFLSLTLVLWAFWVLIKRYFGSLAAYLSIVAIT